MTRAGTAVLTIVLAAALVACAGADSPSLDGSTGVEGTVLFGPACPGPERPGSPCPDRPGPATIRVLEDGEEVASTTAGADGRFRVATAPGTYIVEARATEGLRSSAQEQVTVVAGSYASVEFRLDTGMR